MGYDLLLWAGFLSFPNNKHPCFHRSALLQILWKSIPFNLFVYTYTRFIEPIHS